MNEHEKINKLPKINLSKTLFKGKKKMVIDFNPMTNCFSTKKMKSNLKLNKIEEDNNNNSADSGSILPKKYSRKKYSYISTSNSFKKRNDKNRIKEEKEKEIKLKEEEDENINDPRKYSKHIMDNLNNKLFSNLVDMDLFRQTKDKEIMEQDFEDEVRKYQLLQIMELNNRIREGQAIKSINDVKELYNSNSNKNSNIYSRYFQIKDKNEKKKKNLGMRGVKLKSIKLNEIIKDLKEEDKDKKEKEKEKEKEKDNEKNDLSENNKNKKKGRRDSTKEMKFITYLDIKLDRQPKKEKKKKIDNIIIKDKNIDIELSYFHCLSQVGINKDGTSKINQEAMLELVNILGNSKFNIFGIFSGHGKNGHTISRYISRFIKEYFLFTERKLILKNCKTNKELYELFSKNNYIYIKQLMYDCQYSLENSKIDCDYSGSSCLLIFIIENHLICCNVGNCRAIILEKKDLFQLSFDQTLDIPEERQRIENKGGKIVWSIEKCIFPKEEYQIMLKDKSNKSHYIEMSRSLGDIMFKKVGVDFSPVITEYNLNIETKLIVMGTKGLWNNFSNKQVAYYANKGYKICNPSESCRKIMMKAKENSKKAISIDDISLFILFFNN